MSMNSLNSYTPILLYSYTILLLVLSAPISPPVRFSINTTPGFFPFVKSPSLESKDNAFAPLEVAQTSNSADGYIRKFFLYRFHFFQNTQLMITGEAVRTQNDPGCVFQEKRNVRQSVFDVQIRIGT